MITISIAEDDSMWCKLLVLSLSKQKSMRVVGVHERAEDALREIPRMSPNVVLMDIKFPGMSGIECLQLLRISHPALACKVLVLMGYDDNEFVFEALKAGANGYVL